MAPNVFSVFVLKCKESKCSWHDMNTNLYEIERMYLKYPNEYTIEQWTYHRKRDGDDLIKRVPVNSFGIDVDTRGVKQLLTRLGNIKSTIRIEDGGMYHQDKSYSQVWIKTVMTKEELEDWLYNAKFPVEFDIVGVFDKSWN